MKKKLYTFTVAALTVLTFSAQAQIISTVAGTGTAGYSGDGGAATAANIDNPFGIASDAAGNIYYADYNQPVVRKIDAAGIITTVAGTTGVSVYPGDGGAAIAADIVPMDVAVDGTGNVYIADYSHHRIRKVNTSGIISTIAGTGVAGFTGIGGPATAAKLNFPIGVAVDAAGNVYIADRTNQMIKKINASTGMLTVIAGTGLAGYTGDGGAGVSAQLNDPLDVTVDASGNVYVADYGNRRIRKIDASGNITTFAGDGTLGSIGDGGPATAARLNGGIAVGTDGLGNVYISEDGIGNKVRVVNSSGTINTFAGTGVAGFSGDGGVAVSAQLDYTRGVTSDPAGNIYISDVANHRIRKVTAPNNPPSFTGGATQTLSVCQDGGLTSINSLLTVADTDPGQTKTWSTATLPANGILVAAYSTTSTGGTLTPTGLTYVAGAGYSGSDMFQVRVTDGSLSDTITVNVTVNPKPVPVISVAGSTLGTTTTFATYQWSTGTGPIPGETNATFTAANSGTYYVTVTDANGCTGGTTTGLAVIGLGVHDVSTRNISCYPNPVSNGKLNLMIPSGTNQPAHIIITNMMGAVVKEAEAMTNSPLTLDLNVPGGVYFLSAITDNGRYQAKIVVQ